MRPTVRSAAILAALLLSAQPLAAQRGMQWRGGGGWGPDTPYARLFDPKTIETVSGTVASIDTASPMAGMGMGVHLTLKTGKGDLSVHLGPVWFLENQDVNIQPGDQLQVRGSRIAFEGKPTIVAVEITKGQDALKLRDENGFPLWSGWRRRQAS